MLCPSDTGARRLLDGDLSSPDTRGKPSVDRGVDQHGRQAAIDQPAVVPVRRGGLA